MLKRLGSHLVLIAILLPVSTPTYAKSQINSEFLVHLPTNFIENLIEKKWQDLTEKEFSGNWQIPNQTVQAEEIPVQIRNIQLQIKTQLQKPEIQPAENVLTLASDNLEASLTLGEVEIDHIIEREVGGVVGRFRVQALCRDVTLNLDRNEGSMRVDLAAQIQGHLIRTKLVDFAINWTGAWSSPGFKCTGACGFEELVQNEVRRVADNWRLFLEPHRPRLAAYIQETLNNYTVAFNQRFTFPFSGIKGVQLSFQVQEIRNESTGFVLGGDLRVSLPKGKTVKNLRLRTEDIPVRSRSDALLILPQDLSGVLLNEYFKHEKWYTRLQTKDFPPFQNFMKQRLAQVFVWPDLLRFHQRTNFLFDIFTSRNLNWSGRGLDFQNQGQLNAWMLAPKQGAYRRFMYFKMPFAARSSIRVRNGYASLTVQNARVRLKPYWDLEWVRAYGAGRKMAEQRVEAELNKFLQESARSFQFQLPEIPIVEELRLKLVSVEEGSASTLRFSVRVR